MEKPVMEARGRDVFDVSDPDNPQYIETFISEESAKFYAGGFNAIARMRANEAPARGGKVREVK